MKKFVTISCLLLLLGLTPAQLLAAEELLSFSDGTALKVLYFEPKIIPDNPRLALLISGSNSNTFMARAQFWLGKELVNRGWAIAVPIAPDNAGFGGSNARLLPELVTILQTRLGGSLGKPLLVGVSSGGTTALSIATRYPGSFSGVVAAPGRLQEGAAIQDLHGLPVYLRIGEKDDFRWNRQLDAMVASLQGAGAVVDAAIVADAKHIFQLDWDNLETWLKTLQ
ncbi:MAG: hypothetical protein EXR84_01220 [Gammaproteobacteria bacterium]|nr:hypothetical protein [Gammaproteobacteria bacterium]